MEAAMSADESGDDIFQRGFRDREAVASYAEGVKRFVPGMEGLHRMTHVLLAERVPSAAEILVLGAGGGLELKAMAEAHPSWSFTGVDPAEEMLSVAAAHLGSMSNRVKFVKGYIDDAPNGPFDGATCLLTLHFLDAAERQRTLEEIRIRLRPGAPLVAAHSSFPQTPGQRTRWLDRHTAYAIAAGAEAEYANAARAAIESSSTLFAPEQDEDILRKAGFQDVEVFFTAFTWRGWLAYNRR
jgi:tRNA (cmo5U34)-methyltransferase